METVNFVINLPDRTDRRREMEDQLRRVQWQAQFACAPKPLDPGGFSSIGARGCFLSHLEILRQALLFRRNLVLMEDDLNFAGDFTYGWSRAVNALPDNWSIFYPAHSLIPAAGLHLVAPEMSLQQTHFMLINKSVIPMLIEQLQAILSRKPGDPLGGPMHVDGAYSTIRKQNPDLHTYTCNPPLGYQRASRSDVEGQRFFDMIPALRPAVAALRRVKQSFTNPSRR